MTTALKDIDIIVNLIDENMNDRASFDLFFFFISILLEVII